MKVLLHTIPSLTLIRQLSRIFQGYLTESIHAIAADMENNVQAEAAVPGANVISISVQRLTVAANAAR